MDNFLNGRAFARRTYKPRVVGTALCGLIIAKSINLETPNFLIITLLAFNSLIWAHVAYRLSWHAKDPYKAERRNYLIDSFLCGAWIVYMDLNPMTSATIFSMVMMNNVTAGGRKLFLKGLALQVLGFALFALVFGIQFKLSELNDIWICLPLLLIYPFFIGITCYRLASELQQSKRKLDALSRQDSLTGLLNRRSWNELVTSHLAKAPLIEKSALVVLDIDNFKDINDNYGHQAGDEALSSLSQILQDHLPSSDHVCRYGGDEFCVLLTDTTVQDAHDRMEAIRAAFKLATAQYHPESPITLSIGICIWTPETRDIHTWMAEADRRLYLAKRKGRDCVVSDERFPELSEA
ncbi:diguanylate cyclase [Pseudomonas sp. NPDC089734]|uniref:diguanylate cyclase n=1 Tax=Pseudomonas sp. NPDC089734 TaxID=3364469 RepID=UPI003806FBCB